MLLVEDKLNLSKYNVTENSDLFRYTEFGGLYMPPDEDFSEIPQQTLGRLIKQNHLKPLKGYKKINLEFFPNDLFFEKSFSNTDKAEQFIKNFFSHFKGLNTAYCQGIIKKLHWYISTSDSMWS